MISEFSERAQQFIRAHEAAYPETEGFAAAVDDARKVIKSTPPDFAFTFYLDPNPRTMGGDSAIVFPRLLAETEGWLGFIVHSVAYRLGQFLDDLSTGINDARPYRAVGAARSLVELSAFVYHHTKIILKEANELSLEPSDSFPAAVKGIVMTLTAARHFAQVTRFNWSAMVRGDADEFFSAWDDVEERVKATQILTLIDKLPGEEKRAARFFYEMLCDYVHPNVGAHTLVVNRTEPLDNGQMTWALSREPNSDEAFSILIHAVAIPVRHAVRFLLQDLEQLRGLPLCFGQWRQRREILSQSIPNPDRVSDT